MRRFVAPFLAVVLLLGVAASLRADDTTKYTCDPIYYPDGTTGVAVVKVIVSVSAESAAPTVMVTVDFWSEDRMDYLGRYEDWSSSSEFPTNENEAYEFAVNHFYDRW